MYPLDLEIEEVQSILGECNRISLYTSEGKKIFEFNDYQSYVNFELLKQIIDEINSCKENLNEYDKAFLDLDKDEMKTLVELMTECNCSKCTGLPDIKNYYEDEDTKETKSAINTLKNMKNINLKEKYKDYISEIK
jgi:Ca2+-binding EF-hand superfamily protein